MICEQQQVTLGELVKFVLENRSGKAFANYSEQTIAQIIYETSQRGTMLYAISPRLGTLCGVIVCYEQPEDKLMFVRDILTTEPWAIKAFVREFVSRWPDYTLAGRRYGKEVTYNKTNRLCEKLMKGMN